ncbi:hypothetical protein [Dyella telluris]|uniref:Uncharacterized protein n=1 Tax=Dyella telluris TaxID=2763498 RepID=A0A7G8Q7N0_9GAMM|nr:hypothetical protein [Dyella telluris]QNK02788.1 hypothetical protein H8F01_06580 [Dyella telluris]
MATRDHKARARLSVSVGDAHSDSTSAGPPASCFMPPSLRLSTLDDVALALYALAQLSLEDERQRSPTRHSGVVLQPLPPLFRQGIVVARHCLLQYVRQLDQQRALSA